MADSEKLKALKKAYAEIILNTAKEAAATVMSSERKAERYRRELVAAKDEALRMLLRLKHMLDSEASEAAMTSMIQCKRIEELEAQLGEAEDIVKDLRTELRELQDELEMATNNGRQLLGEQISEIQIAGEVLEENRLSTSGSILSSQSTDQSEDVSLKTTNSIPNGVFHGNKCCIQNCSNNENFLCNPDFASIVMRNKEPELYRNGCTQRIRASESSLYDEGLSLSEKADGAKNQSGNRDCEGDQDRKLASATVEFCGIEESADDKKLGEEAGNGIQAPVLNTLRRKGKGVARCKNHKAFSAKTRPDIAVDHNVQSEEDVTRIDNKPHNDSDLNVAQDSISSPRGIMLHVDVTNNDIQNSRVCADPDTSNNETSAVKLELKGQGVGYPTRSDNSYEKLDSEMAGMLSTTSDPKESDEPEVLTTHPMTSKLKYTFQRKRKRELPSSPDREFLLGSSFLKKLVEETQCASQEAQKSNLKLELPGDKMRFAQVAHQLISLSEKKRE